MSVENLISLTKARKRIEKAGDWTKGRLARTHNYAFVQPGSPDASCWSARGALMAEKPHASCFDLLKAEMNNEDMDEWNDRYTHQHVLDAYDRAIYKLERTMQDKKDESDLAIMERARQRITPMSAWSRNYDAANSHVLRVGPLERDASRWGLFGALLAEDAPNRLHKWLKIAIGGRNQIDFNRQFVSDIDAHTANLRAYDKVIKAIKIYDDNAEKCKFETVTKLIMTGATSYEQVPYMKFDEVMHFTGNAEPAREVHARQPALSVGTNITRVCVVSGDGKRVRVMEFEPVIPNVIVKDMLYKTMRDDAIHIDVFNYLRNRDKL